MRSFLQKSLLTGGICLLDWAWVFNVEAGGSGLNAVVIVNQNSPSSCELGNYFCEKRRIPPENLLRISWAGGNTSWNSNQFQTNLLTPLLEMLASRQLTNQIDYVVLSMDIPFQTSSGSTLNGTTTALFYGLKAGGGSDPGVTNSYAASEAVFREAQPASAPGFSFLTTMITADSLAQAKQLVDQGVASDKTFPSAPVVLAKSSDPARNIRYLAFDGAIFNVRVRDVSSILRTNADSLGGQTGFLGYATGLERLSLPPGTFVPGAIADSLTSFGGVIFGPNTQTNLLVFINAGAAGSYGTVAEPGTDAQKFPDPQVYFYQARGFNLAESYYQSINAPYLGLTVAEPLAAPFARPGSSRWDAGLSNAVLTGTALLSAEFSAADANHPLERIALFVDGKYFQTLTNVGPCPGNLLAVILNGYPITHTVSTNATLGALANGLAAAINASDATNATKVKAIARGDRIELQSIATNHLTAPFYVADAASTNSTNRSYRVAYLPESFPPRFVTVGPDRAGTFRMQVEIPTPMPYVIQASTNLVNWLPIFTNTVPGVLNFEDVDATNFPMRFYRVVGPVPGQPPTLSAPGIGSGGVFQMRVESQLGQPYSIQASTNLVDWVAVLTNQAGGDLDFVDAGATNFAHRFYRAMLVSPAPPDLTVLTGATEVALLRIDNATQPYVVEVSTNQGQWTALFTNFAVGQIQATASSAIGDVGMLSTFLTASRSTFLLSEAFGFREYKVIGSSPPVGAWLQFTITRTNGQSVVVGVTNQSSGTTSADLVRQLCALINTNSALLDSGGVVAEDLVVDAGGTATFNLRARSPGDQAARIQVLPRRYGLTILPSSLRTLTQNLSDLQPRNHLYVTAGTTSLAVAFPLDTTTLADGFHELTAVAYEGSHARTQTRCTVPVRIQNTPLSAALTVLDAGPTAPVNAVFHIEVAANTNDVSNISLFSTGGLLAAVTNQPTATFPVDGLTLGIGLHPFYAIVATASGLTYRTETQTVRLVAP